MLCANIAFFYCTHSPILVHILLHTYNKMYYISIIMTSISKTIALQITNDLQGYLIII